MNPRPAFGFLALFAPWLVLLACGETVGGLSGSPDGAADGTLDGALPARDARVGDRDALFDARKDASSERGSEAAVPSDGGAPDASADGPCLSSATCPSGAPTCCISGDCVDTTSDPNNCGSCEHPCALLMPTSTCDQGVCAVPTCRGPTFEGETCVIKPGVHGTCCSGDCRPIDIMTDPANCGACGEACPLGAGCKDGKCVRGPDGGAPSCLKGAPCPPGDVCSAVGKCVAMACGSDAGVNGNACILPGTSVPDGVCCGGGCVDTTTSNDNCGFCGNACSTSTTFCSAGTCTPIPSCSASPTYTPCPVGAKVGACCGGACVDLADDPGNCTVCGGVCPTGSTCASNSCTGSCYEYLGGVVEVTLPGACPSGDLCILPTGSECAQVTCALGDDGRACPFGNNGWNGAGTCCHGACVDTSQDPNNCGICGKACPFGSSCLGLSTGTGEGDCVAADGGCPSCGCIAVDPNNCGGCGFKCPAGQTCSGGVCSGAKSPCGVGRIGAYCDLDAGESSVCCPGGGCVDTVKDPNNCGRCGVVCGAGTRCVAGSCLATD